MRFTLSLASLMLFSPLALAGCVKKPSSSTTSSAVSAPTFSSPYVLTASGTTAPGVNGRTLNGDTSSSGNPLQFFPPVAKRDYVPITFQTDNGSGNIYAKGTNMVLAAQYWGANGAIDNVQLVLKTLAEVNADLDHWAAITYTSSTVFGCVPKPTDPTVQICSTTVTVKTILPTKQAGNYSAGFAINWTSGGFLLYFSKSAVPTDPDWAAVTLTHTAA